MKVCSRCGELKELTAFPTAATCIDGRRSYCKACKKRAADAWRARNLEAHNKRSAKWVAANPAKRAEVQARNNSKRVASGASARAKREWRERNPEAARASVNYRRRKLRAAMPAWVDRKAIRDIYEQASAAGLTVDHIVPLTHPLVCGLHVPWNLQLLSKEENMKKQNLFNGFRHRSFARGKDGSMKSETSRREKK